MEGQGPAPLRVRATRRHHMPPPPASEQPTVHAVDSAARLRAAAAGLHDPRGMMNWPPARG